MSVVLPLCVWLHMVDWSVASLIKVCHSFTGALSYQTMQASIAADCGGPERLLNWLMLHITTLRGQQSLRWCQPHGAYGKAVAFRSFVPLLRRPRRYCVNERTL